MCASCCRQMMNVPVWGQKKAQQEIRCALGSESCSSSCFVSARLSAEPDCSPPFALTHFFSRDIISWHLLSNLLFAHFFSSYTQHRQCFWLTLACTRLFISMVAALLFLVSSRSARCISLKGNTPTVLTLIIFICMRKRNIYFADFSVCVSFFEPN